MLKYVTHDDQTVEGETYVDVVRALAAGPHGPPPHDLTEYMTQAAYRARMVAGVPIDHATPRAFLASLERAGLITQAQKDTDQ